MKALFGMAEAVPLSRVARDYRLWLIALVHRRSRVNVAALIAGRAAAVRERGCDGGESGARRPRR